MIKLEPNMYVRTKAGMIAKIIDKRDVSGSLHREEIVFILDNSNRLALHSKKVSKASHNIIDLIEVGDYVNGCEVSIVESEYIYWGAGNAIHYKYIETIVTKEQFKNMEYRLGGEE